MASMWSPSTVARADKEEADVACMEMSKDGVMAHVDVRDALIQRLQLIRLEQIEAHLTSKCELLVKFQGVMTLL
jgi:hypothetical protein